MKTAPLYRNGTPLIPDVRGAFSWWHRLRGLLFRPPLAADGSEALLLSPCSSIHTIGMAYPLDLVFLDYAGVVLGTRVDVRPWRMCGQAGAKATLELHGGTLRRLQISKGDVLKWG